MLQDVPTILQLETSGPSQESTAFPRSQFSLGVGLVGVPSVPPFSVFLLGVIDESKEPPSGKTSTFQKLAGAGCFS